MKMIIVKNQNVYEMLEEMSKKIVVDDDDRIGKDIVDGLQCIIMEADDLTGASEDEIPFHLFEIARYASEMISNCLAKAGNLTYGMPYKG
jgi:hypothetical protein